MKRMSRWLAATAAAASLTVLGTGLAAGPLAGAAPAAGSAAPSDQNPADAFLNDVASRLGVSAAALKSAIQQAEVDRIQQLARSGKISPQEAQRAIERIQSGKVFWVGPEQGRRAIHLRMPLKIVVGAAAQYLGMQPPELIAQLRSGKSLSAIAGNTPGKTVDGLAGAIQSALEAQLAQAVKSGRLSNAHAQAIQGQLPTLVEHVMTKTWHPVADQRQQEPVGHAVAVATIAAGMA